MVLENKKKERYEKPKLRTIELASDEVLSTGCKMEGNPVQPGGGFDCSAVVWCSSNGS